MSKTYTGKVAGLEVKNATAGQIVALLVMWSIFAIPAFGALIVWLVTVLVGAGFQTMGIDGPGWETVAWFVFAARLALAGSSKT